MNWILELWWKIVFRMWGNPKPAPEYQLGWKDMNATSKSLKIILCWDFERIIIYHGDLIEENAKVVALNAWRRPISSSEDTEQSSQADTFRGVRIRSHCYMRNSPRTLTSN
ncbi:MAG: hypothetical protein ACQ9ET_02500 [Nitrosomonadaceae bacterium]